MTVAGMASECKKGWGKMLFLIDKRGGLRYNYLRLKWPHRRGIIWQYGMLCEHMQKQVKTYYATVAQLVEQLIRNQQVSDCR